MSLPLPTRIGFQLVSYPRLSELSHNSWTLFRTHKSSGSVECSPRLYTMLSHGGHLVCIVSISVQSLSRVSRVWLFVTPWTAERQASLSITNCWSLLKLMSIELVMSSNHLILCRPLLLPSIFPSFRVFSNESAFCIRWPKYWSFSFSISSFNEYSGLISFRMDWLDLPAVQGTLKSLLQHHSSKASILQRSVFSMVQLSHPYTTTGKTIALTRQIFVGKGVSLLFNMLSRLVIVFLPRSKRLLTSWLQSPSTVHLVLLNGSGLRNVSEFLYGMSFLLLPFVLVWSLVSMIGKVSLSELPLDFLRPSSTEYH